MSNHLRLMGKVSILQPPHHATDAVAANLDFFLGAAFSGGSCHLASAFCLFSICVYSLSFYFIPPGRGITLYYLRFRRSLMYSRHSARSSL